MGEIKLERCYPDNRTDGIIDAYTRGIELGIELERKSIMRCRDCKYYEPNTYSHFTCELLTFYVEPDGFCAWGEHKEARNDG